MRYLCSVAALAAVSLFALPAQAALVEMEFTGVGNHRDVKGQFFDWTDATPTDEIFGFTSGSGGAAGYYKFDGDPSNPNPYKGEIRGFCIEANFFAPPSGQLKNYYTADVANAPVPGTPIPGAGGMGVAKADALARAVYAAFASVGGVGNWWGLSSDQAGALNTALWEIIYEKPGVAYNPDSGYARFYTGTGPTLSATLRNLVVGYLAAAADPGAPKAEGLVALTNSQYQDYLVPEPTTLALLGLAVLARGRRR